MCVTNFGAKIDEILLQLSYLHTDTQTRRSTLSSAIQRLIDNYTYCK